MSENADFGLHVRRWRDIFTDTIRTEYIAASSWLLYLSKPVDLTDAHAWNFFRSRARLPGTGRAGGPGQHMSACTKFSSMSMVCVGTG